MQFGGFGVETSFGVEIGVPSRVLVQAWSTKNQAVEQMLPPSRFWRGMFPDIRKLPLEVLAWERIEFRRGVGFGVEIQVSLPIPPQY